MCLVIGFFNPVGVARVLVGRREVGGCCLLRLVLVKRVLVRQSRVRYDLLVLDRRRPGGLVLWLNEVSHVWVLL